MDIFKKKKKRRQVYFDIDKDVHMSIKLLSIHENKPMYDIVNRALKVGIKELLEEYKKKTKGNKNSLVNI